MSTVEDRIVLQWVIFFSGISGDLTHVYRGAGSAVLLPCGTSASSTTSCSGTAWYFKTAGHYTTVVRLGKVVKKLPQGSRMSLDPNCSLVIRSIAAEDAGLYMCGQDGYHFTFMSVLKSEASSSSSLQIINATATSSHPRPVTLAHALHLLT